ATPRRTGKRPAPPGGSYESCVPSLVDPPRILVGVAAAVHHGAAVQRSWAQTPAGTRRRRRDWPSQVGVVRIGPSRATRVLFRERRTMSHDSEARPPFPPFTRETAIQKVRMAEDAWNSRDPERVALAYTVDSAWRNR